MQAGENPDALWRWQPPLTDDLRRKLRTSTSLLVLVIAGAVVAAALSPTRWIIVLALLLAGIGVLWWVQHRRFRSTRLSIAPDGRLSIADNSQSATIELARVDTIAVRQRAAGGRSMLQPNARWSIELAGPDDSLSHEIALAGGLFNLDEKEILELERALRAQAAQHGARLSSNEAATDASPQLGVAAPEQAAAAPIDAAASDTPFEWRPPVSPGADRRRRWIRIGYLGCALVIAIFGGISARDDGIGAILLTALTVPGMIVLIGGAFDYMSGRARRFRLTVSGGVLCIDGHGAPAQIDLRGATVAVERRSALVQTGNGGSVRSASWWLEVRAADGEKLARMFPSWGTSTSQDDYVALERELRRRVGTQA